MQKVGRIFVPVYQLPLPTSIMDWLSLVSLRMLFPTCIQSLIFSEEDDDASFGGDEEPASSRDLDQVVPCTKSQRSRSEAMLYEPQTSHLASNMNYPVQPIIEVDPGIWQAENISSVLAVELSLLAPSSHTHTGDDRTTAFK